MHDVLADIGEISSNAQHVVFTAVDGLDASIPLRKAMDSQVTIFILTYLIYFNCIIIISKQLVMYVYYYYV